MRVALFEPDIPQNTGSVLRTAACFGIAVDVIEPCGFVFTDRHLRRAGLDYLDHAALVRHPSWAAFRATLGGDARLVLLTTRADQRYTDFSFAPADVLLFGRETAGVPDDVHEAAAARLRIPLAAATRSLNVACAAAVVMAEALRQTDGWPS